MEIKLKRWKDYFRPHYILVGAVFIFGGFVLAITDRFVGLPTVSIATIPVVLAPLLLIPYVAGMALFYGFSIFFSAWREEREYVKNRPSEFEDETPAGYSDVRKLGFACEMASLFLTGVSILIIYSV